MNQRGLVPLYRWFERLPSAIGRINVHAHDALFFSVLPAYAYDVTKFLVESLEAPHRYWGVDFQMPCEVKLGLSWKGTHEWKRLPSRDVFEAAVAQLGV